MFHLKVLSPNLDDGSVVILVKSNPLLGDYSVVCGLWSAQGGLPTEIDIDALCAYASNFQGKLQDGVTISADISSSPLSEGNVYLFNGTAFVQNVATPQDIDYGLSNGRQVPLTPLTCGLCQKITINGGIAAMTPVAVESLRPGSTTSFQTENRFWLGLGQFPPGTQTGLLLSTSLIQPVRVSDKSNNGFAVTLGTFALVDFSEGTSLVATYQPNSGSFQINPAENSI